MTTFVPPNPPNLWQSSDFLTGDEAIVTWIGCDGSRHPLSGGMSAMVGVGEGVNLQRIKGLTGQFKHLDQQGARQDGVDWQDTVWEPMQIDMTVVAHGLTPKGFRRARTSFLDSVDPKKQGRLVWFTKEYGEWWADLRLLNGPVGELGFSPETGTMQQGMDFALRADDAFWTSFDSVTQLTATSSSTLMTTGTGMLPPVANFAHLWNRGDQQGWPRYLLKGPGTFKIGDVGGQSITFGPLKAGQSVLITTLPRKRNVKELFTGANLFPLMVGRFTTPVPALSSITIPVSVTGAQIGVTQVTASLTPYRKWPD